jgi:hypothetical protein
MDPVLPGLVNHGTEDDFLQNQFPANPDFSCDHLYANIPRNCSF